MTTGASSTPPKRILAIKLADTGDLLLATPALRAIKESFPDVRLDVLTTPNSAPVLHNSPLVDNVLFFDKHPFDHPADLLKAAQWVSLTRLARQLRIGRYDTVILFHHLSLRFGVLKHAALTLLTGAPNRIGLDNGRGWFLTIRVKDDGFGARHELDYGLELAAAAGAATNTGVESRQVEITINDRDRERANEWLPAIDLPTIALHPGSGGYSLARRWELGKFTRLGRQLMEQARVVVAGTLADGVEELAAQLGGNCVNLGGKTTVAELAAVLERCDLLVGADSGVLHMASAVGTPVVALFGPTNHRAWAPALAPEKLTIVRSNSACSPCAYNELGLGAPNGCPHRTCMAMITVDQVLSAIEKTMPQTQFSRSTSFPTYQSTNLPVSHSTNLPIYQSTNFPISQSTILGIPVNPITYDQLVEHIGRLIAAGRPQQIATVNPEFVMTARRDPIFRVILGRAALCLPDGVGLIWASRWLHRRSSPDKRLRERVTGSDGTPLIARRAAREGWRLFLLGAAPGVAERTAAILQERCPGLQIAGTSAGNPTAEEEESIVRQVNQSGADILFVAYGAPKQDKWIARNLPRLEVSVAMGVGGSFDFICGKAARAPHWMQRMGLEWLHRLLHQPWRWRRMLALPRFALAVFWAGLKSPENRGSNP